VFVCGLFCLKCLRKQKSDVGEPIERKEVPFCFWIMMRELDNDGRRLVEI